MSQQADAATARAAGAIVATLERRWSHAVAHAFHEDRELIAIVLAYSVLAWAGARCAGYELFGSPRNFAVLLGANATFLAGMSADLAAACFAAYGAYVILVVRPRLPLTHVARTLSPLLSPERVARGLPFILLYPLFATMLTSVKVAIPVFHPFAWDASFAQWDSVLGGGEPLWRWLFPLFGGAVAVRALDLFYVGWLPFIHAILLWQVFRVKDRTLRERFLLSFALCWIVLGSLSAVALSSAGPCYFGAVTGLPDPYGPLMQHLRALSAQHPILALEVQDYLWSTRSAPNGVMFDGISAMPSMHVALTTLCALLGWRLSWRWGTAFTLVLLLVVVGSVELGWHYELDDCAAIAGAIVVWFASGVWQRARPRMRD